MGRVGVLIHRLATTAIPIALVVACHFWQRADALSLVPALPLPRNPLEHCASSRPAIPPPVTSIMPAPIAPALAAPSRLHAELETVAPKRGLVGVPLNWRDNSGHETCLSIQRRPFGPDSDEWVTFLNTPTNVMEVIDGTFFGLGRYCYRIYTGEAEGISTSSNKVCIDGLETTSVTQLSVRPLPPPPEPSLPSAQLGQWLDRPLGSPDAKPSCPQKGQWLLLYWAGPNDVPITSAAASCPSADRYWLRRGDRWLGFAPAGSPDANDQISLTAGEAALARGTGRYFPPTVKPPDFLGTPASPCLPVQPGDIVTLTINVDVPSPRCVRVTPDQRLRVMNSTPGPVQIQLGRFDVTVPPGGAEVLDAPFGQYLAPGVHLVQVSTLAGGPTVWLLP